MLLFHRVRARSKALITGLAPEDTVVQSMPDASPTKWHLAHTTWFFEELVLAVFVTGYRRYCSGYDYLFNSHYNQIGPMHLRAHRGFITRPTLAEVLAYRERIDAAVLELLATPAPEVATRVELGCQHEQQHQELLVTDIKHVLAQNPLVPVWRQLPPVETALPPAQKWQTHAGELVSIGHAGAGFSFDNETPRHRVLLEPFAVATRPVTNAEYGEFIVAGGYDTSALWLADGWARIKSEGWRRPLYWNADNTAEFTVAGLRPLEPAAPVSHLSYYEADAFARWAGARLPTEAEWEAVAAESAIAGNCAESERLHPAPSSSVNLWGDVWEWTASA
jgi:ergothioneine biosynthesis protein EgtB